MITIYLARHGESTANAGGKSVRNPDIRLSPKGHQQAENIGRWLYHHFGDELNNLYISKFIRTLETAQPLMDLTGLHPTIIDGLEEFTYLPFAQIEGCDQPERHALAQRYWQTSKPTTCLGEDAESFQQFANRVDSVLDTFRHFDRGTHVAFTHGTWLSMLAWQVLGNETDSADAMRRFRLFEQAMRIPNTAVYRLSLADNHTAMARYYQPPSPADV